MDKWAYGHSVRLQFIERASPSRTPILNRSTAGCEEECLNGEVFASLNDARRKIGEWHQQYNQKRSHSSLGYLTPESFAAATTKADWKRASALAPKPKAVRFWTALGA
jgi:putative transposase